jgi:hypothetical protein
MRRLKFTKMQGLGNDFVVLDGVTQPIAMHAALARRLADRHFGIGCDQILLVEPATTPAADFRYRIWNADGGEVEEEELVGTVDGREAKLHRVHSALHPAPQVLALLHGG